MRVVVANSTILFRYFLKYTDILYALGLYLKFGKLFLMRYPQAPPGSISLLNLEQVEFIPINYSPRSSSSSSISPIKNFEKVFHV